MKIILIAAVAENRVIGFNNSLPWSYPEDLAKFKEITSERGAVLLMGRKTYDSLPVGKVSGEKLTGRKLMVITNTFRYPEKNAIFNTDIESSLDFLSDKGGASKIFIIGGASIYSYFLKNQYATDMMITEIKRSYQGNVYFPKWNQRDWVESERSPLNKDCDFVHYKLKT